VKILENMARQECSDEGCFALTTKQLIAMAERGDARAVDELERRAHNRQHKQFVRGPVTGEASKDPGFFVPPSLGGPVRRPESIPHSEFPENEIKGVMSTFGVDRAAAIKLLQKCEMHQRSQR
jgi:hypothetical protein